jgi:hypothetical protein
LSLRKVGFGVYRIGQDMVDYIVVRLANSN